MERVLLYYPTIEVPKENWLRQALLYSDKVSSILPYSDESKFPENIKYLHWKGEFKPIYIENLIERNATEYEIFRKKFIAELDSNQRIFNASSAPVRKKVVNSLFTNKLSQEVIRELERRNLIKTNRKDKITLPENVAIYYMSILAKFVSSVIKEDLFTPSTDYKRFSSISFENGIESDKALNLIFANCLPVPEENVGLSEIIDFKRKYKDELLKFRRFYTYFQNQLRKCRDNIDLNEGLISMKETIEIELSQLTNLYSKNRIKTVFTSLDSLFGIENPKLFTSLLQAGIISTAIEPKIGIGIGTVIITCKIIDNIVSRPNITNEFNYLFEAKRKRIIK